MAHRDQSYKAGEAAGQAQEKTGQMGDAIKGQAQGMKDKASEMAGAAQKKAGEAKDQAAGYMGAARDKTSETAQAAKDRTGQAAQGTKDKAGEMRNSAQAGKQSTEPNIAQRAGQQLKSGAQGAVDAVKNTFGMADDQGRNE